MLSTNKCYNFSVPQQLVACCEDMFRFAVDYVEDVVGVG
jgi:hypothetical protein